MNSDAGTFWKISAAMILASASALAVAPSGVEASTSCTIIGTPGDDVLTGTEGPDVICALAGDDVINGLGGDDLIYGGPGDDNINAGMGADTVWGLDGDDTIDLGGDADLAANKAGGGAGSDTITGSGGPDVLYTGPGLNNTLRGLGGNDTLTGHGDATSFETGNILDGGDGDDVLYSGGGLFVASGGDGNDVVYGSPYDDLILGGGDPNAPFNDIVYAGAGNDTVLLPGSGPGDADLVALGPGDDFTDDVGDFSIVYGGPGRDFMELQARHQGVTAVGGPGDDGLEADIVIGQSGSDALVGNIIYAKDSEADRLIWFNDDVSERCVIDEGLDTFRADSPIATTTPMRCANLN